jgi:hypothetical protein
VDEDERSLDPCHPERSEGSDSEAVVLSEAKDLFLLAARSFVATLLRMTSSSLRSSG